MVLRGRGVSRDFHHLALQRSSAAWMAAAIVANPNARDEFSLDAFRVQLLGRTIGYNVLAAIIATVMGLPAGYVLGAGAGAGQDALGGIAGGAAAAVAVLCVRLVAIRAANPAGLALARRDGVPLAGNRVFALKCGRVSPADPYHVRPNGPADIFRCIWSLGSWLWAVPAGLIEFRCGGWMHRSNRRRCSTARLDA